MDVIEHLRNPVRGLENIRKLLKADGMLIVHTPNVTTPARFFQYLLSGKRLKDFFDPKNVGDLHFQTYDYLTLEQTLNFVGLKVLEVIPTKVTLPLLSRVLPDRTKHWIARLVPFLADTLLLKITRVEPIDLDRQIDFWNRKGEGSVST